MKGIFARETSLCWFQERGSYVCNAKLEDRTLFIWVEPVSGDEGVDVFLGKFEMSIVGNLSQEEKRKVAEGLKI